MFKTSYATPDGTISTDNGDGTWTHRSGWTGRTFTIRPNAGCTCGWCDCDPEDFVLADCPGQD